MVEKLKQWIVTVFLWFKSVHIKCHGAYSDTNVGQVASYPGFFGPPTKSLGTRLVWWVLYLYIYYHMPVH